MISDISDSYGQLGNLFKVEELLHSKQLVNFFSVVFVRERGT